MFEFSRVATFAKATAAEEHVDRVERISSALQLRLPTPPLNEALVMYSRNQQKYRRSPK